MEGLKNPFKGIRKDVTGRLSCYKQDWVAGICSGLGILAPTTYIFFASALPVIAFGEQISRETVSNIIPPPDQSVARWELEHCGNLSINCSLWDHTFHIRVLEGVHASFVESVPFKYIATFTIFQFMYLMLCFGVTWIPIAGILFPLPFFLLVSIRQHVLPKIFQTHYLQELDAAEYEEIAGAPQRSLSLSIREHEMTYIGNVEGEVEICDAEILDELTTNRGELKVRAVSFGEDRRLQVLELHMKHLTTPSPSFSNKEKEIGETKQEKSENKEAPLEMGLHGRWGP
ncbi:hypothetical protein BUALT_Bualt02G0111000 [Buddleja alternifolia]|uniref:Bicarbonate transporter-like transmembrane domain-containing protein n=1 Tax=Buddleja alternifolia TaxID=168488 RepID=A0AAV6Y9Z1_9LAMI|nr:hypothetical protein BUALT_Bualt02G0111000 [Buddleja alternifolia]